MGPWHVVCRTCATEGLNNSHEAIKDSEEDAKTARDVHREANRDHDVIVEEVA